MPATPAWLAAVEASFERGIRGSAQARTLAARLEGTALRIEIDGLIVVRSSVSGGRLALVADAGGADGRGAADGPPGAAGPVQPGDRPAGPAGPRAADATITGSPFALFNLAKSGEDPSAPTLRQAAKATVRGDAEIANLYRRLFAAARPDPEEELARFIGDLPARKVSQFAAHTLGWMRKARRTTGANIAEYLQEESRDLVNRSELEEFLQGVDALRESADRAGARLARLERRLKGSV